MAPRLPTWLLLIVMATSGAYAVASPRVTPSVRIEISIDRQDLRETRAEKPAKPLLRREIAVRPPAPECSPQTTDTKALYQRPPPLD